VDAIVDRIGSPGHRVDVENLRLTRIHIGANDLAERPLRPRLVRHDDTLQHHLRLGGYHQVVGPALDRPHALAQERARDGQFVKPHARGDGRGEEDRRMDAVEEGDRHRLVLGAIFVVDGAGMARHHDHAGGVAVEDLLAVDGDVELAGLRVANHGHTGG